MKADIQSRLAGALEHLEDREVAPSQQSAWESAWRALNYECARLWPRGKRNQRIVNLPQPDVQVWLALARVLIERSCLESLFRLAEESAKRAPSDSVLLAAADALLNVLLTCCQVHDDRVAVEERLEAYCEVEVLPMNDAALGLRLYLEQQWEAGASPAAEPMDEQKPEGRRQQRERKPRSQKVKEIIKLFQDGISDVDTITDRVDCSADQVRQVKYAYKHLLEQKPRVTKRDGD